jgi:hypothetical protein
MAASIIKRKVLELSLLLLILATPFFESLISLGKCSVHLGSFDLERLSLSPPFRSHNFVVHGFMDITLSN